MSEASIEAIKVQYSRDLITQNRTVDKANNITSESVFRSLYSIFQSQKLCLRFLIGCYLWISCCFCYYGIGVISMHVSGENQYTSFLIVAAILGAILVLLCPETFQKILPDTVEEAKKL